MREQEAISETIRTFVIGVGNSLSSLNLIAQAGGTDRAFLVDTDISGIPDQTTVLVAGTITVTPEPGSIVLALVAAAGLSAAALRRRRHRAA